MDLLGSILNSMDKPPEIGNKERVTMKKQKEQTAKRVAAEKQKLQKFREKIEEDINRFIKDDNKQKYKFEPMEKVFRTIAMAVEAEIVVSRSVSAPRFRCVLLANPQHDVADVAGLTAFSFGEDEVDRYVMIFKKEYAPSDDELLAYRKGEEWDPEKAREAAKLKELADLEALESSRRAGENVVNPAQKEKHDKRFGKEASKDAEKIMAPNRQFGFVSSENKKDLRSIEQTLADIREKKRQKIVKDTETEHEDEDKSD